MAIQIAQESHPDEVLSNDPFALLVGMLLDQQYPMDIATQLLTVGNRSKFRGERE